MIKSVNYMIVYVASLGIEGAEDVGQVIQIVGGKWKWEVVDSSSAW